MKENNVFVSADRGREAALFHRQSLVPDVRQREAQSSERKFAGETQFQCSTKNIYILKCSLLQRHIEAHVTDGNPGDSGSLGLYGH